MNMYNKEINLSYELSDATYGHGQLFEDSFLKLLT